MGHGFLKQGTDWKERNLSGKCFPDNGWVPVLLLNLRRALMMLPISGLLASGGCSRADGIRSNVAEGVDLTDRLMPSSHVIPDQNINRDLPVIRKGMRKNALILIAPASVRASLKGVSGKLMLHGLATPVYNIGDGIRMDLFLNRAGRRYPVGNRYFDPGRSIEDRAWIPIAFPMDVAENDQLEIEVSGGPQGDLVADWLALSSWHLMHRKTVP